MPAIQTLTGDVNLRAASAKCHVWHASAPGTATFGFAEALLFVNARNGRGASTLSMPDPQGSVLGFSPDIGGKMTAAAYDVCEGEILKLISSVRSGPMAVHQCATMFLRVRANAAVQRVDMPLLNDPSCRFTGGFIQGPFDVLTPEQVDALEVKVPEAFRRLMMPGPMTERLFRVTVLQEAKAEVVAVTMRDGKQVQVETAVRRRKLRLD